HTRFDCDWSSDVCSSDLPPLPFPEWETTCDTVHMWTQIVGKTRMTLTPIENHYWNVTLYVTPRGLTTSPIPYGEGTFDVAFDFRSEERRVGKECRFGSLR